MTHVAVAPPEMEPLAGIFLPCLERARALARVAQRAHAAPLDLGRAWTTAEAARCVAGAASAEVAGGPFEGVALGLLAEALRRAGIAVVEAGRQPCTLALPLSCLLLLEPGEPVPAAAVAFVREDDRLRRSTAGAAGSIPAWVDAIQLVGLDGRVPAASPSTLLALDGWETGDEARVRARCRALGERAPGRVRLLAPRVPPPAGRLGGAAFAARYGLHLPAVRARLERLVAACFPEHWDLLQLWSCAHQLGVDPLEEAYAGNALADRNQDLVENLRG